MTPPPAMQGQEVIFKVGFGACIWADRSSVGGQNSATELGRELKAPKPWVAWWEPRQPGVEGPSLTPPLSRAGAAAWHPSVS